MTERPCDVMGCDNPAKNQCAWCNDWVCDAHRVWTHEEGESVAGCYACFLTKLKLLFPEQQETST